MSRRLKGLRQVQCSECIWSTDCTGSSVTDMITTYTFRSYVPLWTILLLRAGAWWYFALSWAFSLSPSWLHCEMKHCTVASGCLVIIEGILLLIPLLFPRCFRVLGEVLNNSLWFSVSALCSPLDELWVEKEGREKHTNTWVTHIHHCLKSQKKLQEFQACCGKSRRIPHWAVARLHLWACKLSDNAFVSLFSLSHTRWGQSNSPADQLVGRKKTR